RNDGDSTGAKRERLKRCVIAYHFQGRAAVEHMDQFIPRKMAFPMIFPRCLNRQKQAVAVGSQLRDTSFSIRRGRLRSPPKHRQLRELGVEIDDARRSGFRDFFWLRGSWVVNIMLDVVAGERRTPRRPALLRAKPVPRPLWNDGDHSRA